MQVLDNLTLVVVDVETTGLSAAFGDRICEVGLVRAQGDAILDTYQTLVNPQRPISPGASRVNGLHDGDVHSAPPFATIAERVLAWTDGAMLVCHNAPFDLGFLEAEFSRLKLHWQPAWVIDTLEIARRHFNFDSNSLPAVADRFGIETPQAHRALGDALTTFQVLRCFQRKLGQPGVGATARNYPAKAQANEVILPPEIQEALAENKEVIITYIDAKGIETIRRITPLYVQVDYGIVYLTAYCHLRQAERNFRLDRVLAINRIDYKSD
jgi:DNA polymerase-3 subunit epsilon